MSLLDPLGALQEAKTRATLDMASAVCEHLRETVASWKGTEPTAVAVEDVTDALAGVAEALDLLREDDVDQASEQIEAVAGALDPELLEPDSVEGAEPEAHAEPKE